MMHPPGKSRRNEKKTKVDNLKYRLLLGKDINFFFWGGGGGGG